MLRIKLRAATEPSTCYYGDCRGLCPVWSLIETLACSVFASEVRSTLASDNAHYEDLND